MFSYLAPTFICLMKTFVSNIKIPSFLADSSIISEIGGILTYYYFKNKILDLMVQIFKLFVYSWYIGQILKCAQFTNVTNYILVE